MSEEKKKRKFGKRVVSGLDWTLLPISEIRLLRKSIGSALRLFKELVFFSWAIIRVNSKELTNTSFYKNIAKREGPVEFATNLSHEQKYLLIQGLDRSFLFKRLMSILFVTLVFLIGALFFVMAAFSPSPSIFRTVILFLLLMSVGAYLWVSIGHYDNLKYFYKHYCTQRPPLTLDATDDGKGKVDE